METPKQTKEIEKFSLGEEEEQEEVETPYSNSPKENIPQPLQESKEFVQLEVGSLKIVYGSSCISANILGDLTLQTFDIIQEKLKSEKKGGKSYLG